MTSGDVGIGAGGEEGGRRRRPFPAEGPGRVAPSAARLRSIVSIGLVRVSIDDGAETKNTSDFGKLLITRARLRAWR